MFAENI